MSCLEQLRKLSVIVADSGDINQLKALKPQDGTTNPSLILQASQIEEYASLITDAVNYAKAKKIACDEKLIDEICDRLNVNFGAEILKHVPGVVSTEVDAALSFDVQKSVAKGKKLIAMYEELGIKRDRVLIKLASTWEGCQAAKELEKEGIHCNMTLIFSIAQAIAAAEAGATLISPFVGRILDWFKAKYPTEDFSGEKDPGVKSVTEIFNYYKKFGHKTIVMGASFRSTSEITLLAGCDKLTISPKLLNELQAMTADVPRKLDASAVPANVNKIDMCESNFRWMMNEDQMATEKLSDGIRVFNADMKKLRNLIKTKL